MTVKPIPDGHHSVTPFFMANGAGQLIDFLSQAFGARERLRMPLPDGHIAHAEVILGNSVVMVADASPKFPANQLSIHLYVEDVDGAYRRALDVGATSVREPENRFYGDRSALVRDPFGNTWSLATHVEDISEDEMKRRMAAILQI